MFQSVGSNVKYSLVFNGNADSTNMCVPANAGGADAGLLFKRVITIDLEFVNAGLTKFQ
jgi:hypothetical protein